MRSHDTRKGKGWTSYRVRWSNAGVNDQISISTVDYGDRAAAVLKQAKNLIDGHGGRITREEVFAHLNPTAPESESTELGMTLNEWFERWYAQKTGVEIGTHERCGRQYELGIRELIIQGRPLGQHYLNRMTRETISLWIKGLQHERGIGANTVRRYYQVMRQLLTSAMIDRHISHDPTLGVKLPKPTITDDEDDAENKTFLTKNEADRLLGALEPGTPHDLVFLATGARWSELTALRKRDVLIRPKQALALNIQRAWKRSSSAGWYIGPPKSKRSKRKISLPKSAETIVKARMETLSENNLLFSFGENLRIPNESFVRFQLAPAIERAG